MGQDSDCAGTSPANTTADKLATTRFIDIPASPRSRLHPPREYAVLGPRTLGRVSYYPSPAAEIVVKTWGGMATMRWEVDVKSNLPVAIHLLKPTTGRKYSIHVGQGGARPHFSLPTSALAPARCQLDRRRPVKETSITAKAIVIAIPSGFFFLGRGRSR